MGKNLYYVELHVMDFMDENVEISKTISYQNSFQLDLLDPFYHKKETARRRNFNNFRFGGVTFR